MKDRRRAKILGVAERLFRENGYAKTSLSEIADAAEVSIGTIYTYFGSKGGIIRELAEPLVVELSARADEVIQRPPADPVEAMIALFQALRFTKDWQTPNLVLAFDRAQAESDRYIELMLSEAQTLTIRKIRSLLDVLKYRGSIRKDLNLDDVTFVLENLMATHLEYYVQNKGRVSLTQMETVMYRRARLLFEPWYSPSAIPEKGKRVGPKRPKM
ncbi:MAG TPA: TetR/AcrR family transcriptional regulator [Rhizomicrobium sp.]|jgi:AcrR family transcriptional regulator